MDGQKELTEFMKKKNREARGEIEVVIDGEEEKIKNPPKSVNQESSEEDIRAAKALAMARTILNMLFVIPLAIVIIALFAYISIKFLPTVLFFIRRFFVLLMAGN